MENLDSPLVVSQDMESQERFGKDEILAEVKKQLLLAGPLVSVNFLLFALQLTSVMFVGHLGNLALSGASIATSFASVTGFSLLRGMASALDTFCGQSYGAKQYHMLGVYLQTALIVLLSATVPLALIWANATSILLFFGQDPEISAEAGRYARFMLPSIFGFAIQECHIRFLQAQNNVVPMMVISGFTTLLHILVCWILVFKSGLGNKGAALANAFSYWTNAVILTLYVRISRSCKKTWTGYSMEAVYCIPKFLRLSIPSAVMLSLEVWSFEMMVLLSGLLPNPKLETSVLAISLNTCSTIYMIPLGLSAAVSTRSSNELGAERPRAAFLAVCVTMVMVMVMSEGIVVGMVMISGRKIWGYLYSEDEQVVKYVGQMFLLIAASHFVDGIQSVLTGVARGCGWQKMGAVVNLGAYHLIGIPSSIILAFVCHLGGKGLWTGIIVALTVQASCLAILTLRTKWEEEATKAVNRATNSWVQCYHEVKR
ncbi:MATE efflux family protein 9-like [Hibiscus syriacus]|uniref:Protein DETOXIFICATION n=1 Tax=Hibiscus syriacus TaxID=106335 RepID=A0A6A2YJ30_HIBSY|nr:protein DETOXIFICATION 16-like [Hibiscus syriacus]KAE8678819.1 MATE efflux family protein 9-like [Hibiscus syriacus]